MRCVQSSCLANIDARVALKEQLLQRTAIMSSKPPSPVTSFTQEHEDNGYKVIVLSCVFSTLCIAVVVARFYAVRKRKAELWWDDWLCIPSLVSCLRSFFSLQIKLQN